MPTYADLYNERLLALGQTGPSNPVRLTIARGDYVWDPELSRFRYEEQWEEEHLMEHEELPDPPHLASPPPHGTVDSRNPSPPFIAALQPMPPHAHLEAGTTHQPSLWVLDTNTLISCLALLKALFAALLTRNVAYTSTVEQQGGQPRAQARPSPIKLVIPYAVISELDGLKITRRKDDLGRPVASQAREANHWLLSALQKQKRVTIDQAGAHLTEHLWPLFLQPSAHYNRSKRSDTADSRFSFEDTLSVDDEIVKFCVDLKRQTSSTVCFCSDDINARTKAELDNIDSLGMRELANALKLGFEDVQSSERKWSLVAEALIDQWEYQIGASQQSHYGHQDEQQYRELQKMQDSIERTLDQGAWQSAVISPAHSATRDGTATQAPHTHCSHVPTDHPALQAQVNNRPPDMDMDLEDQLAPPASHSTPIPLPLMSDSQVCTRMRTSSPAEGRGIKDSIHSPHNVYRVSRPRSQPSHTSTHKVIAPTAHVHKDERSAEADALNPQIDWQDLVQELAPSSRGLTKHRNGN